MPKFPIDAPRERVVKALQSLGFVIVRDREHIAMTRRNTDGTTTPLTLPRHSRIKSSTLRAILRQSEISREDFLKASESLRERLILRDQIRSRGATTLPSLIILHIVLSPHYHQAPADKGNTYFFNFRTIAVANNNKACSPTINRVP